MAQRYNLSGSLKINKINVILILSYPIYFSTVTKMWPFISDFIKRILRETVEPSIKALLPQMKIQFTELSLGDKSPRVVAIKVYERKDGDSRDRIELDMQLAWISNASFKLKEPLNLFLFLRLIFFNV